MFIFLYTVFRNSSISDEHVFCVALHFTIGHLILIKDTETNRQQIFRFWSRTGKDNPKSFEKHKIELKPYEKARFEKGEELEVLGKVPPSSNQLQKNMQIENLSIYKVRTDVLGNQHIIKNEGDKPKLDF